MKRLLLLLFAAGLVSAETIEYKILKDGVLEERLRLAHPKTAERFARLRSLFERTGCKDIREQKVKGSKEPNLICAGGESAPEARTIVVGAHFDCAGGDGLVDNWTGAILLPSLAEFLREKPRRHAFQFVGFAGEEKGLLGSSTYVKSLTKEQRQQIAAAITLDSLGLTPTKCWPNGSSKELIYRAAALAQAMKLGFGGVNMDNVGMTDSVPFQKAGVPVLSLHSVTAGTLALVNSRRDVWTALSWRDYYDTHRFVSALLVYLDQTLP